LLFQTDETILNVTADGGNVTIEAVNGYQIIKKAILQEAEEYHSTEENAVLNFAFETIEKIMNKGS
jgi:hypothetical protein